MFQVLHSSAGAGKTHALVKHYLGHCLTTENSAAYRHVLALTFTNKAAGEMKERVVHYLELLAKGATADGRIQDLMDHLKRTAGVEENVIIARSNRCLGHMLHHWSDVAISTIDSFTRRVVRPFARDLQLDHELNMTTEEQYYRDLAVDTLIAEVGTDERLTELLSEVCAQLLHDERKWDPERPLRELSGELSKESSIRPLELLRQFDPDLVPALAERTRKEEILFRNRVHRLGERALELIEKAGLAIDDLSYGRNGIHSYFRKLRSFTEDWDPPGSNATRTITTDKWHSGKAGTGAIAALNGISGELRRIFQEAEQLREEEHAAHVMKRAVLRELLPSFALHELAVRLEQVKAADAVAFFSDLTRKVSDVVKHEPVPFIYERLGERYRHFLIDEFQDTSMQQWNALLPLLDNALSTGGSALLVGDAKQAIYRWRNGEVRLFVELPKIFGRDNDPVSVEREATLRRNHVPADRLAYNHRSAGTIIEFNNNLFASLKEVLAPHLRPVYKDHEQLVRVQGPGLVWVEKLDKDLKGEAKTSEMLRFTRQAVEEALEDGFAPGDIAILVRSKNTGRTVAEHLVAEGHSVVSPDGLRLSGDPVIELLMDHLRYFHTQDATAAARIAQYQGIIGASDGMREVEPFTPGPGLPDPVKDLHQWMKMHGDPRLRTTLSDLIAELARAHGIAPAEDAQVMALLDEAHSYAQEHGQDLGGFLEHWERTGGQRGVVPPDNGQAIQVMTVHRSKGLQFPVVIVPNACMSTRGDNGERLWIDPGAAVPELESALVRGSKALRDLGLPELEEEAALCVLDALDLLYVAFTRPEQRLYVKVPEAGPDAVTAELLTFITTHGVEGRLVDGQRTAPWKERSKIAAVDMKDVRTEGTAPSLVLRLEAPVEWDPADPDPYRSHGNTVHEILAAVRSATDLAPAIQRAADAGDLSPEQAGALLKKLGPLLASRPFRPYFGAGLGVRSECSIITTDGRTLRPDRVVEDALMVRVLDIKTGKAAAEHVVQVREYMHHLMELTEKEVEGALFYVNEGTLLPVILHEDPIPSEAVQ